MAGADWTKPIVTDAYAGWPALIAGRDNDIAVGLDPAIITTSYPTSPTPTTGLPNGAIRFRTNGASPNLWERWNSTTLAWSALAATYNISISGTAATATTATTATNQSGGTVNATTGTFSGQVTASAGIGLGIGTGIPTGGAAIWNASGFTQIQGGTNGFTVNNNANTLTNVTVTDAGAMTLRAGLTATTGTFSSTVSLGSSAASYLHPLYASSAVQGYLYSAAATVGFLNSGGGGALLVNTSTNAATFTGAIVSNGTISVPNTGAAISPGVFSASGFLQIAGGTNGFTVNNNANTVSNLVITNAGAATFIGGVSATTGTFSGAVSGARITATNDLMAYNAVLGNGTVYFGNTGAAYITYQGGTCGFAMGAVGINNALSATTGTFSGAVTATNIDAGAAAGTLFTHILQSAMPTHGTNTTATPVKAREYKVPRAGTFTTRLSIFSSNASATAFGQVYKNGAAVGTLRSTVSVTAVTFDENIAVVAGDLLQFYGYTGSVGFTASCSGLVGELKPLDLILTL